MTRLERLPANVATVLINFLDEARDTLGDDLVSAVLFGSAAEARLTATSDVNLILVLRGFDAERLGRLGDALLAAEAAIQLKVMFLLESSCWRARSRPQSSVLRRNSPTSCGAIEHKRRGKGSPASFVRRLFGR